MTSGVWKQSGRAQFFTATLEVSDSRATYEVQGGRDPPTAGGRAAEGRRGQPAKYMFSYYIIVFYSIVYYIVLCYNNMS